MNDLKRKKREDKERINSLFKRYVTYREEKVLWKLVIACKMIIKSCLNKYDQVALFPRWYDDIYQDTMMKLYLQLQNPNRRTDAHPLEEQFVNPFVYLYFLIRSMVKFLIDKFQERFGQEILFCELDERVLNKLADDTIDPEILYILRHEIPQEFFDNCVQAIRKDISLKKFPEVQERKIRMIKQMIEDAFGVLIDD